MVEYENWWPIEGRFGQMMIVACQSTDATHRNVTVVPSGLVDVIGYYHGEVCPPLVDTSVHTGPC